MQKCPADQTCSCNAVLLIPLFVIAGLTCADQITIRLVAELNGERQLLSDIRIYRLAPGGLVARDWLGGTQVNGTALFPKIPFILEKGGEEKDEFLSEVAKTDPLALEKRKRYIDPLYDGKAVGPEFLRPSEVKIDLTGTEFVLTPGDLRFSIQGGNVITKDPRARVVDGDILEIECLPVTVSAVIDKGTRHFAFQPQIFYEGRNLLEDILYERDEFYLGQPTKGSERSFLRLQLYLIPNRMGAQRFSPYRIQGAKFWVGKTGMQLVPGKTSIRKVGDKTIQLALKPRQEPPRQRFLPIVKLGPIGYHQIVVRTNPSTEWYQNRVPYPILNDPKRKQHFFVRLGYKKEAHEFHFSMPADQDRFPLRVCALDARKGDVVDAYVFSSSLSAAGGRFEIRITANRKGKDLLAGRKHIPAQITPTYFAGERSWRGRSIVLKLTDEPGIYQGLLPDDLQGLVSVTFPDFIPDRAWVEIPVINGADDNSGSLSFLTPRNRIRYEVGEDIEIHAVLRSDRIKELTFEPVLLNGKDRLELAPLKIAGTHSAATLALETDALAPGVYRITADVDGLVTHALGFELFSAQPPTDYPSVTMKPFSHETPDNRIGFIRHLMGAAPNSALRNMMPEERHALARGGRLPFYWADMLAENPLLPPPEKADGQSPLQQMLSHGISQGSRYYWEPAAGYVQYNIKHTTEIDNARMYRVQQMYVQQARGYASFGGLANYWHAPIYGYWEGTARIDGHQPLRNRKVAEDFQKATGQSPPGRDEIRALLKKQLKPTEAEQMQRRLLDWRYWQASVLPKSFDLWHKAMDEIQPGLWLLNRPPSGWSSGASGYPPAFFGPLDAVSTYNITDFGRMPFDLPYGTSLSTAGVDGRPKFVHAWTFSRAGALSEALLGLTMGADGVDPSANAFASHNLLSHYPTYDRRQVMDLLSRYGRFITRLGRFKDIAILFSARQAWGNVDRLHLGRVRSLYHDLLRSRRSPHILLDEDMKVEKLEGYRALFLLGLTVPLSPEARAAIREFEDSGGVVIKDEHSSEECPGQAETLWGDTKPGYPRGDGEYEFVYTWEQYLKRQPALEKILERIRRPFVQTHSPRRLIALASGRQVKFAAVINDELIPTTLPGKYRQHHALPVKATVTFDQPYVVYDLQKKGEFVKANGLDLSFNRSEARLFALVREPFEELNAEINTNLQAGQALRLKISVADRAGTIISDPLPFELSTPVHAPAYARWFSPSVRRRRGSRNERFQDSDPPDRPQTRRW